NIGDQNYELPVDLDLSNYGSVVIWCVPFRVPFNAAPLSAP
ncbi:MAG: DM13 domain-containing protein, partial [Chloroflexi bacterium]|nr:DM13 domain-containing protein [Chloroflexota bacterium]